MTIIQRNPVTGEPTGVIHPEPGESRHFAPTPVPGSHAAAEAQRAKVGGPIAPTGPIPMVSAQNTDYFA